MAQTTRNRNISNAFNKINREVDNIRVYIQTPDISSLRPSDVLIKLRLIVEASEALQTLALTQDNQLISRLNNRAVLAEGRVVNLETQLKSCKLLYHFQKATCIERGKRISELLQEKFAFRFIFRKQEKWKRQFKDLEVRFNNLQKLPPQPGNQVWLLLQ